jgi:stage V sporulation protein S
MSGVDMSLDDLINKKGGKAPGGRRPASGGKAPGATRGGRPTPYERSNKASASSANHLANADVRDVAASENPVLKVKGDSKPNSVAGAICNIVRESASGQPPSVVATGPAAINQAMKAIAIARKYLLDEDSPTDMVVYPRFEEDIRQSSRVCFELKKSRKIKTVPSEDDLACKDKTDPYKLAGAMAGRVRDGEQVACTTKGPVPVLIAVKAMALAQTYVADEGMEIKFAVSIVDLENPEIRGSEVTSTYLHFALVAK